MEKRQFGTPKSVTLYWADINRFLVYRFDAQHGTMKSWFFDEPVVAVTVTPGAGTMQTNGRLTF